MTAPDPHEPSLPEPAPEDASRNAAENHPDGAESEAWEHELRQQADQASSGSDESAANTLRPEPPEDAGLHGALVTPRR